MVCLDTAFIADLFRKNPDAERKLKELVEANEAISVTVITLAELYQGAYKSSRSNVEKARIEQIKRNFLILEMDERDAEKFGELASFLEKSGKKVSDRDVLIAAIAISKGEKAIVTRNAKHFARISGLSVITY
jgi:tRNA(fMet)-specific endonuclease VapC